MGTLLLGKVDSCSDKKKLLLIELYFLAVLMRLLKIPEFWELLHYGKCVTERFFSRNPKRFSLRKWQRLGHLLTTYIGLCVLTYKGINIHTYGL